MRIIGIDSAVQDSNFGLVAIDLVNDQIQVNQVWNQKSSLESNAVDQISTWIQDSTQGFLLAIDAPLGWPSSFGKLLHFHHAGQALDLDIQEFFIRKTDLDIHQRFRKKPLEVAADRIGRTAFATLSRLHSQRQNCAQPIPILVDPSELDLNGCIEVYPAATFLANGLDISHYKKDPAVRQLLLDQLYLLYSVDPHHDFDLFSIDHVFDAFVCCLSGLDFIHEIAKGPKLYKTEAIKEGWIWTKDQVQPLNEQ